MSVSNPAPTAINDTELPAAAAGADAAANATAPAVDARISGFNGTTWDRIRTGDNLLSTSYSTGALVAQLSLVQDGGVTRKLASAQQASDANTGANILPSAGYGWNGASVDRLRTNVEATLLASAARTATTNSPDQTNYNGKGVHVSIDVTVEGPATISMKIQGKHSVGGTYYDIADFGVVYTAATDTPGPKTGALYPGILAADHVGVGAGVSGTIAKSGVLPRTWRVVVSHADATTCTYSLSAVTVL